MNKLEEVIKMITDKFKEENGEGSVLEEGDEVCSVFNDGVVILGVQGNNFSMKILCGEPYKFDYDLGLTKREEDCDDKSN